MDLLSPLPQSCCLLPVEEAADQEVAPFLKAL
jgi:hypothetical protein